MSSDVWAPPEANLVPDPTDAEQIRSDNLRHETAVRSVGSLYFVGAVLGLLMSLPLLTLAGESPELAGLGLGYLVLSSFTLALGIAVRRLRPWTRVPIGLLSGIGLLAVPVGTLINGYILYLVFGKRGQYVFSPEYQQIVASTPHIRQKTSPIVIALGLLLIGLLGLVLVSALIGG